MNIGISGSKRRSDEIVMPAERFRRLNNIMLIAIVTFTMAALMMGLAGAAAPDEPTLVRVEKNQTLNEAIADVEGPVRVILPEGVTEHTKAITRAATVIVKGQGENISTLRPASSLGPDEGVALVAHRRKHGGDLVLSDFTYDRRFQPGITPGDDGAASTGATVLEVAAGGRAVLRNVTIHRFDFGARKGETNSGLAFSFRGNRQERVQFENVRIDFKKGGGIRHRPGSTHRAFGFGRVDRIRIDRDCVIRAHLCQNANPAYTVGDVWRGRGRAGTMYGMAMNVFDRAYIDGVYRNCDYGVARYVTAMKQDTVVEWRMDVLNAGYGDQFWNRPDPQDGDWPAGHWIFRDVRLVGHRTGDLWNDFGLRCFGGWKSVTVDGCTVINRGHPLSIWGGGAKKYGNPGKHLGQVTIRNTTVAPDKGGRQGLVIRGYDRIDGIKIDDLNVHADPMKDEAYYSEGIWIEDVKSGGMLMASDVRAQGYIGQLLRVQARKNWSSVNVSNIEGQRVTFSLPEGSDFGLMQRKPGKGGPKNPQPDYHYGAEMPGYFGDDAMSSVEGTSDVEWRSIEMGYTRTAFHVTVEMRKDQITPIRNGAFSSGDRFRIGLALGVPGNVEEWHEIEVAAAGGKKPIEQARVRLRRYPGGNTVDADGIRAGLKHHTYDRKRWSVRVPWSAVNINPEDEMFWVKRRLSVDLAYVDVDGKNRTGTYQFLGRSGVLDRKTPERFKEVFLREVDWGE